MINKKCKIVDMHMHTLESDGTISLNDLLDEVLKNEIQVFSITEHETMANTPEAKKFAKENQLTYITGVELTVNSNGRKHILGYGVDENSDELISVMLKNLQVVCEGRDDIPENFVSPKEAIDAILSASGVPILAHPGCPIYGPDYKTYINQMIAYGVQGIECYHPENSKEVTEYCLEKCRELDLYITGGSDYHGNCHPDRKLNMMGLSLSDLNLKELI